MQLILQLDLIDLEIVVVGVVDLCSYPKMMDIDELNLEQLHHIVRLIDVY